MRLKRIGDNETELEFQDGLRVLFSYQTPVAYDMGFGSIKVTNIKYSRTTSKHINKWVNVRATETVSQGLINDIVIIK